MTIMPAGLFQPAGINFIIKYFSYIAGHNQPKTPAVKSA